MIFFTSGKTATEIYDMLRLSSEEETMSRTQNNLSSYQSSKVA
jgi:hypothetical protein